MSEETRRRGSGHRVSMSPCLAAFVEAPAIRSKSALRAQYIDAPGRAVPRRMGTQGRWCDGFEARDFELGGMRIHARTGGRRDAPPLLLRRLPAATCGRPATPAGRLRGG